MTAEWTRTLETPCIVIDMDIARRNIETMQRAVDACGCKLRPHIKTHKMPLFTRLQLQTGASGITCAKVSEAEVMADAGAEDIFIAYPAIGDARLQRIIALAKRVRRLILTVDSIEGARMLEDRARGADIILEVRIEVDTGLGRTGISMARTMELYRAVAAMEHLRVTGVFTFKSLVLAGQKTTDAKAAAREEAEMLRQVASDMESAGADKIEVSAGSTPTGLLAAQTGLVDEVRPGTYVLGDFMLIREGAMDERDVAARMYATVVSVAPDHAVIDGGSKTFPMDTAQNQPPYFFDSYVHFVGRDDLKLRRMNEEHGIVTCESGETGLRVGDVLEMMPLHICPAMNLQNDVYILEDGQLRKEKVAARGMLL